MTCAAVNSTDSETSGGAAGDVGKLRRIAFAAMALASFALYAAGVLALHQDRTSGWDNERDAMAAAVSYLAYGTHFGAVEVGVERYFLERPANNPYGTLRTSRTFANGAEEALAATVHRSTPRLYVRAFTIDGSGAGLTLFVIIAMLIFGPHASSLTIFYLMVVGVSSSAFMLRYRDERQILLLLYFLIGSVMLLTPISTVEFMEDTAPIGGYRLFTLAAILPILHLYCEIVESRDSGSGKPEIRQLTLLLVQGVIFFAILVERSSAGYLIIALITALLWRVYRGKIKVNLRSPLAKKMTSWSLGLVLWAAVIGVAMPQYVEAGRVFGVFWHRAFISLGMHPQWPFGNLGELYKCNGLSPPTLTRGASDGNGHCVWIAHLLDEKRDISGATDEIYGGDYERDVREAYFYVVTHYPKQVFEVYAFTKSMLIALALADAWTSLFHIGSAPVADSLFAIVAMQAALFITFIVIAAAGRLNAINRTVLFFPLALATSLLPLYVAWAAPWTTGDTVFLLYCCIALVPAVILQWAVGARMRRGMAQRAEPGHSRLESWP